MLPLLTSADIRRADAWTIEHEPIPAIDLMERASRAFVGWFINHFPDRKTAITVYAGTGNNGGDGLAIARMLHEHQYNYIQVRVARYSQKSSADFDTNLQRLHNCGIAVTILHSGHELPPDESTIIIDALLGSGLNKPLHTDFEVLANYINSLNKLVVAVDVPTGFFTNGEIPDGATIVKADLAITFQQARINFLLPEAKPYVKCWEAVNIGISEQFAQALQSPYQYIQQQDVRQMLKPRSHFSNKGTYGHALIIAGEPQTMGAALLCASAAAYAGAGLTTACIPASGLTALNTFMPELMAILREGDTLPAIAWQKYSAIAFGPGLGMHENALELFADVLYNYKKPMVIDADGLNLLSQNTTLWQSLPPNSILTPHMKEFDRLFGEHTNWWARIQTAKQQAAERQLYIILKNDYTITATPDGMLYFNSTSNPAMATGGMGDALTGIITALLAQGYTPQQACIAGVYLHGKAGDELALPNKQNVVMPTALARQLPTTMAKLMA